MKDNLIDIDKLEKIARETMIDEHIYMLGHGVGINKNGNTEHLMFVDGITEGIDICNKNYLDKALELVNKYEKETKTKWRIKERYKE